MSKTALQDTSLLSYRIFPALTSAALVAVVWLSAVPPTLHIVDGVVAKAVTISYAGLVGLLAIKPGWERLHLIGAPLAVLTFGGRAGGFLEAALSEHKWSLAGAVAERLVLALALVLWHRARTRELAIEHQRREGTGGHLGIPD